MIRVARGSWLPFWSVMLFLSSALFPYFLPGSGAKAFLLMGFFAGFCCHRRMKLWLAKPDVWYWLFLLWWIGGCFLAPDPPKGLGYCFTLGAGLLFCQLMSRCRLRMEAVIACCALICLVFVVFLHLQPVRRELVAALTARFPFSELDRALVAAWARNRWYCGLFPDRAPAAFWCSALVGLGLCRLLSAKGMAMGLWGGFCMVAGFSGLLLTAKRGLLAATVLSALLCWILTRRRYRWLWMLASGFAAGLAVVLVVRLRPDAGYAILERFSAGTWDSGRLKIYREIWRVARMGLLLGAGTGSAGHYLGVGGHNIYLTLLMENGVPGLLLFLLAAGWQWVRRVRRLLAARRRGLYRRMGLLAFALYVQTAFLLYGFTGNPLYDDYILLFYCFSMLVGEGTFRTSARQQTSCLSLPRRAYFCNGTKVAKARLGRP